MSCKKDRGGQVSFNKKFFWCVCVCVGVVLFFFFFFFFFKPLALDE